MPSSCSDLSLVTTAKKADLFHLIGCGHEVQPIHRPRLFGAAQFTFHHPRRPLPPLPARRIFRLTWLPPGACRIRARNRHPGTAFFCSNLYSNLGCGRTFSVLWDEIHSRQVKAKMPDSTGDLRVRLSLTTCLGSGSKVINSARSWALMSRTARRS